MIEIKTSTGLDFKTFTYHCRSKKHLKNKSEVEMALGWNEKIFAIEKRNRVLAKTDNCKARYKSMVYVK